MCNKIRKYLFHISLTGHVNKCLLLLLLLLSLLLLLLLLVITFMQGIYKHIPAINHAFRVHCVAATL